MTTAAPRSAVTVTGTTSGHEGALAAHEGLGLYSAGTALLKGLLECDAVVSAVYGPRRDPFASVFSAAADPAHAEVLARHDLAVTAVPSAARGIALALDAARSGRCAVALVPNDQLAPSAHLLAPGSVPEFRAGGAACMVLADDPLGSPGIAPRQLAAQLDVPCLEPADVAGLRDFVDSAVRLSRAVRGPTVLVAHAAVLSGYDTVEARVNRVIDSVDALLARRRRRRSRVADSADVLRMIRRLELNRAISLPSPGERVPVGFVTVGPTTVALHHLARVLSLQGRIPVVELGATNPIDDVLVARLLGRCERVIVLEPRPGVLEAAVLSVAEPLRRGEGRVAHVWGRLIPPPTGQASDTATRLGPNEAVHPSLLARRIAHCLHEVRPTVRVAQRLAPPPPPADVELPALGSRVGPAPALAFLRRLVVEVDQALREREPPEDEDDRAVAEFEPRALQLEGAPVPPETRGVRVELWSAPRFQRDGVAAVRHAARERAPWIMLICDTDRDDGQDLVRFIRGVIPGERAARVTVDACALSDRAALRERITEAAIEDGLAVLVVTDGPPARFDVAVIERELEEVDRLGFEPRDRVVRAVDRACSVRPPAPEGGLRERLDMAGEIHGGVRVDRLAARRVRARLVVRPMLEQVDVVRSRPPERRGESHQRLPVPDVLHRSASSWRCHVAGYRGEAPGVTVRILADAGRRMGYAVRSVHDSTPVGPGRRASAQILFTREEDVQSYRSGILPFNEADLVLGVDAVETLRAIVAQAQLRVADTGRTFAVVNDGAFRDEARDDSFIGLRAALGAALRATTRPEPSFVHDVATLCRRWFHTERLADVVVLGAAYQLGLVPVNMDAMLGAVEAVETRGIGQARRAFQLGRRMALDPRGAGRVRADEDEDIDRTVRRTARLLRLERREFGSTFARLARHGLAAMPGLAETEAGREARRDFVTAIDRCLLWGGADHAERFAQMVTDVYAVDRADKGRSLTRSVVLPLATAMLVREPIYVAAVTTSADAQRRLRRALNVRPSRGDTVERRFLTRFELSIARRRIRVDLRTSDWTAHVVAGLRRIVPAPWRGTRRERRLRAHIIRLVQEATSRAGADYDHYAALFARLHAMALEDRLRGMTLPEARMVTE